MFSSKYSICFYVIHSQTNTKRVSVPKYIFTICFSVYAVPCEPTTYLFGIQQLCVTVLSASTIEVTSTDPNVTSITQDSSGAVANTYDVELCSTNGTLSIELNGEFTDVVIDSDGQLLMFDCGGEMFILPLF